MQIIRLEDDMYVHVTVCRCVGMYQCLCAEKMALKRRWRKKKMTPAIVLSQFSI